MPVYTDMMDRLDLKVHSPNKQIRARLVNRDQFDLKFVGNAYREHTEEALARQLEAVAQLLWVGRRKAALMARREALGEDQEADDERATSLAHQELLNKRKEITAQAVSGGGNLKIAMNGWTQWKILIKPRTLDRLSEEEFVAEARSLFAALLSDYRRNYDALLKEYHRKTRP